MGREGCFSDELISQMGLSVLITLIDRGGQLEAPGLWPAHLVTTHSSPSASSSVQRDPLNSKGKPKRSCFTFSAKAKITTGHSSAKTLPTKGTESSPDRSGLWKGQEAKPKWLLIALRRPLLLKNFTWLWGWNSRNRGPFFYESFRTKCHSTTNLNKLSQCPSAGLFYLSFTVTLTLCTTTGIHEH